MEQQAAEVTLSLVFALPQAKNPEDVYKRQPLTCVVQKEKKSSQKSIPIKDDFFHRDVYKRQGYNWWLESIQAPSAWAYNNRFSKVKVGIVDTGLDSTHEDLNLHIVNASENSVDNHGTLCAGIIRCV